MFNFFSNKNRMHGAGGEFERIIAELFDGVIAYDKDFRVFIFNAAAQRLLGMVAEDVIGKKLSPENISDPKYRLLCQILFPSLAPFVITRSREENGTSVSDMTFPDVHLALRVSTGRISDESGDIIGFSKVLHDRTREEDMLKSKSEFIEVAAHQLRTPLTSINWIFESLIKENLSDSSKELVGMGQLAASNVLKTVNDLLDVSQIEEGRFGYKFQNHDLVAFVEEVLSDIMPYARENEVKIYLKKPEFSSGGNPVMAHIDAQKLGIALSNLVSNAVKYNIKNGDITVEIGKMTDKPFYEILVRDTGIGIPPENLRNLFSKFFRADNAQKKVADGTGLGLYISKNIIKRHGGEIWVESELNRGTTFHFTIPSDPNLVPRADVAMEE